MRASWVTMPEQVVRPHEQPAERQQDEGQQRPNQGRAKGVTPVAQRSLVSGPHDAGWSAPGSRRRAARSMSTTTPATSRP